MKKQRPFVISQFTNPSGETAFRLSGWLDDKRIRKNFSTRAEAEAERQVFEINTLQADGGVRAALTRLTNEQLLEAEAVFQRLAKEKQPLAFCVNYALANYRAPQDQKALTEAAGEYLRSKEHEFEPPAPMMATCAPCFPIIKD